MIATIVLPPIVTALAMLAAVCANLRARRLGADLRRVSAELDQANLCGATLAAERDRAERRAARNALRSIKRRTALRRLVRYHRETQLELSRRVAEVMAERDSALGLVEVSADAEPTLSASPAPLTPRDRQEIAASAAAMTDDDLLAAIASAPPRGQDGAR